MKKILMLSMIFLTSATFGDSGAQPMDAFSIAIKVADQLYCKPLGLEDVEFRVSTGLFELKKAPIDFRVTVYRKRGGACVTVDYLAHRPAKPVKAQPYLLQIDVQVAHGKLLGFTAKGEALNCSQPVKDDVLQARRKASLAIAGELMEWKGIEEVPARGGGTVLFFRYEGEETFTPLNSITFGSCNGLLKGVGSLPLWE